MALFHLFDKDASPEQRFEGCLVLAGMAEDLHLVRRALMRMPGEE